MTKMAAGPVDLVALDNQDVVLAGLRSLPISHPEVIRTVVAHRSLTTLDVTTPPPHVVVLDYWLGRDDEDSLDAVSALKAWGAAVLLYTSEERPRPLRAALRAGVDGLCLKNDGLDALVHAVAQVITGSPAFSGPLARAASGDNELTVDLTNAQCAVLEGLSLGLDPADVARQLGISENTVRTHERNIHDKYRTILGDQRITRSRLLYEALRDGYWEARPRSRSHS